MFKMELKCFIYGNQLCVVREDFINLQESPALFIPLKKHMVNNVVTLQKGELV